MSSPEEKLGSAEPVELGEEKAAGRGFDDYVENPEMEQRITRKCDFHILPWIFALWLLAFIDRSNIGNAYLDGLEEDLNLVGNQFNVALTVFYILYILLDIPSNWLLKIVGGGRYLPILACAWGIVSTCVGSVKSLGGLIACRLLLGACEGGMFGGIILYLSMFYKRHNLMFRLGVFYCAAPLSGAFGGLLATGLAQIHYHGYNGWLAAVDLFRRGGHYHLGCHDRFLLPPEYPGSAPFLSEEEQYIAAHRLRVDLQGATSSDHVEEEKFSWPAVRFAILNVNTLLMSLNFFLILIPIYSYSLFLPSLIEGLGYSDVTAQLFTVPPNFLAFLIVLASSWISDRIKMRGPLILIGLCLAAIGYIMQLASKHALVKYGGTFFIAAGMFPCSPLISAWLSNNLAPHYTKATGVGFQVALGNCGAFVATFTYLSSDAPKYTVGHSINLGAIGLALIGVGTNILYIRWENAARRAGKREYRFEQAREGDGDLGYRHPEFRYTM